MAFRGNFPQQRGGGGGNRGRGRGDFHGNRDGGRDSNFGGGGNRGRGDFHGDRGRGGFGRGRGDGGGRGGRGGPRAPARPHVLVGEGAIFPLEIRSGSIAFRYNVSMDYKASKYGGGFITYSLTQEKRDTRMRVLCFRILSIVMEATNDFGVDKLQIAYDNQNTLYATQQFTNVSYTVTKDQLPTNLQSYLKGNGEITVEITPNEEMSHVDLSDVSQYEAGGIVLEEDQTVRQVIEIILTQGALNGGEYDMVGNGQLYRLEEKPVGRGLCTRIGTSKGIRMIEVGADAAKKIVPALVVDFKCSPFYATGNLMERVNSFVNGDSRNPNVWEDASKFFSGCKVCPSYDRHRVVTIKSFDVKMLSQISFNLDDGQSITLPDFYRTKKRQPLQYPNSYAVNVAGDKGQFPMELLTILPNQRVSLEKVPAYLRDQVHRANAVPPQQRYENIMDEVDNMQFNNDVTNGFGIHVTLEPIEKASVLQFERPPKPKIFVGNNVELQPNDDGKFDLGRNRYYQPCNIGKWGIIYGRECNEDLIHDFHQAFKNAAQLRGITFQFPAKEMPFDSRNSSFQQWYEKFKMFKDSGVSLIILIDSKNNTHSHGMLKMLESVTKVLTQHITLEVATKVVEQNQFQTLGNILLKINVKNGGLNYKPLFNTAGHLDINKGNVLVVGFDVTHPTGVSPDERRKNIEDGHQSETRDPSVVGITANVGPDPSAFFGDFFFQATRQEKVDKGELRIVMRQFLTKLKGNRKKLPSIIVILRDGVSEGQFKMTYEEELPAIQQGVNDFDSTYKPKFVFVICTKRHHKRFFEGERGKFFNPQAGSFVEDKFSRPDCMEFFMQCHNAIKGTAKFVQVSVVLNEPNVTKKELFGFLHSLSYGHQIVCSPVSLPTPIYQADELAARGFEVYNSVKQYMPQAITWKDGEINYYELSHLLNYSDSLLGNRRFNA